MHLAAAVVLVLALLLTLVPPPPAEAASSRRVCARVTLLRDSPEGIVIGRLYRRYRIRYHRRSANRRWALVTRHGVTGWVPYRSLCRA